MPTRNAYEPAPKLDILVIDDNEDLLELVCIMLEKDGHRVRGAAGGEEGIRVATDRPPDVLFSDLGLPDMSGCEVAKQLRANDKTKSIRMIAVSGSSGEQERELAKSAGFEHLVAKPVAWATLQDCLRPKQE